MISLFHLSVDILKVLINFRYDTYLLITHICFKGRIQRIPLEVYDNEISSLYKEEGL